MAEELGTRDVLEQVDARMGNVEQDIRGLRSEVSGLGLRLESQSRWLVGVILASWLTLMASIWLKT
jgi:hypothetical protein